MKTSGMNDKTRNSKTRKPEIANIPLELLSRGIF